MASLTERIKNGWNAFVNNKDPSSYQMAGYSSSFRPDRIRLSAGNERSIVTAIYNRIALDVSSMKFEHVRTDDNGQYLESMTSGLNQCLTLSANIDQTGRELIQDIVMSMFDEGCVAVVPTDTSFDPMKSNSYDILRLRTGKILEWFPEHVRVRLYNDRTGRKEDLILSKNTIAIVENPMYSIMNEPNSTLKRLIHKLTLIDAVDEQSSSGKLDLIIQLPYVIKTEARRKQADARRKEIEMQLAGSRYGIAYTDGTEKITQINRSVENNLLSQIEYLQKLLYSQLGLTEEILNGTANEQTMLNYYNRTIEPIAYAIVSEMKRKFLTKTAITQNQSIEFIRDPFKLVPVNNIADIADRFTRNEILSSNEIRGIIGFRPSDEPSADELRNKNLYDESGGVQQEITDVNGDGDGDGEITQEDYDAMMQQLDSVDSSIDDLEKEAGV